MNLALPSRATLQQLEIVARRELAGIGIGHSRSRQRGQGMEFSELRPYQPGDDIRRLDFSASARTGVPYTRLYHEERAHTLTLLADLSPSCTPAKRQLLCDTAALLAFAAVLAGNRLALVAFSDRVEQVIRPGRGLHHARRVAAELFALQAQGRGTDLAPALAAAGALNRRSAQMVLLSDLHCDLDSGPLRALCARHELIALLLRDAGETAPQRGGLTLVRDSEDGRARLIDLGPNAARTALAESWRQTDLEAQRTLQRHGVRSTVLYSGQSPLPALRRLFQTGVQG